MSGFIRAASAAFLDRDQFPVQPPIETAAGQPLLPSRPAALRVATGLRLSPRIEPWQKTG
jgi:hypothetical protein